MALLLFVCVWFWGAHKSLAPRARTLLGVLGQATLSFFAVATLLFFFFCECPKFCDLAKQRRKTFWGVTMDWVFASLQPCRGLWVLQPTHTLADLQTLKARVGSRRSLATSVIIVCPTTHVVQLGLTRWYHADSHQCTRFASGSVASFPFLQSQGQMCLPHDKIPVTIYWVTNQQEDSLALMVL